MTAPATESECSRLKQSQIIDIQVVALAIILLVTTYMRFTVSIPRPLWIDEVHTGMVAMEPTLTGFVRQCADDVGGPIYYILAALWGHIGGYSNASLRFPAAICGVVAPLIPLIAREPLDRQTRFFWSAILACWIPGIWYSQEARCYSLVFMLAVMNAIAFIKLLRIPSLSSACVWAAVSALLILSHYVSAAVVGVQGIVYLFLYKKTAASTWPSLAFFLPVLATIAVQARNLLKMTDPSTSWFPTEDLYRTVRDLSYVCGHQFMFLALMIWLVIVLCARLFTENGWKTSTGSSQILLWICGSCSVIAIVITLVAAYLMPFLEYRYLTAFVPGFLMELLLLSQFLAKRWSPAPFLLVAFFCAVTLEWSINYNDRLDNPYNFETASSALMKTHPTKLVFLWDLADKPKTDALARLGGFFFARAGQPVTVDPIRLKGVEDPNPILVAHAAKAGSAILWIYYPEGVGVAARRYPPRIAMLDQSLGCKNFGQSGFEILACDRAWGLPSGPPNSDEAPNRRRDDTNKRAAPTSPKSL